MGKVTASPNAMSPTDSRLKIYLLVLLFSCSLPLSSPALGWGIVNAKIRREFPGVKRITTAELAAWLNDKGRPVPLLLDVRTRAEFAVSHLPQAGQVEPDAPASVLQEVRDRAIVTYCSVGYRSGAFAARLQAAGFTNVLNLEGSIFQWANEGRPIYRGATPAKLVHPYNGLWGMLLEKKRRANVPSVEAER